MSCLRTAMAGAAASLSLMAAGAAGPAQALTYSDKMVICPLDGRPFMARVVNSYTQFGVRLDLKPYGALDAPTPLPVCPGNGFVMFKRKFTPAQIATIKKIVFTDAYRKARAKNTNYYMAGYIRERMGAGGDVLGHYYLRASWEAENGKLTADQRRYMALALAKFDGFLGTSPKKDRKWWTAQLLAANIERKLGRFAGARVRLERLPVQTLAASSPLRAVHRQIADWTGKRNTDPQNFVPAKKR